MRLASKRKIYTRVTQEPKVHVKHFSRCYFHAHTHRFELFWNELTQVFLCQQKWHGIHATDSFIPSTFGAQTVDNKLSVLVFLQMIFKLLLVQPNPYELKYTSVEAYEQIDDIYCTKCVNKLASRDKPIRIDF